jgi:hypothetical protein
MLQVRIRTGCRVDNLVLGVDARLENSRFFLILFGKAVARLRSCRCRIQNLGFLSRKSCGFLIQRVGWCCFNLFPVVVFLKITAV